MLPLGDVVPRRTRAVVTWVVVVALLLASAWFEWALTGDEKLEWLWSAGVIGDAALWSTVATTCWIDPAWPVVVANAMTLALFGRAVEDRLGHFRYVALLALAVYLGAAAFSPANGVFSTPAIGALAPVSAVVAAYSALFPQSKLSFFLLRPTGGVYRECQALWGVFAWALLVPCGLLRQVSTGTAPTSQAVIALAIGAAAAGLARVAARRERLLVSWWDSAAPSNLT